MPVTHQAEFVSYDDAVARRFEPFALTRPWSEMRVGALLVRERWELATGHRARGFMASSAMRAFREPDAPHAATGRVPAGTLVVNSRCAVALDALRPDAPIYRCDGRVAAVRLETEMPVAEFAGGRMTLEAVARAQHRRTRGISIGGVWCDEVWDPIRHLSALLSRDLVELAQRRTAEPIHAVAPWATVTGSHSVLVEADAQIEPHTVFDASNGPIRIGGGATVQAFTRLVGPCVVGRASVISGGRISGSAIGDTCKVNGELSSSIFVGHANKGHDGFVGHSMLGRWVNLGAGTTTSNLKNTYGSVALWTPDGVRDTGLQFLGTLFGDHVKTGIGLRLTTGCVLGAGANVVDQMPPKVVAPFAWGSGPPYGTYDADKFVETAARVMARRSVELDPQMRRHLLHAHSRRWMLD
jgi:UDP-N-acetylglucosamine diphosphorylase / glucose-1-phosphate thymidylyltransferase / UDP-N-acetylgalactosamine diphosphorylase / glucosamine-1-phosphate N-acetyltransferase / galactosamine-1-phosphate N-acetyltransferase